MVPPKVAALSQSTHKVPSQDLLPFRAQLLCFFCPLCLDFPSQLANSSFFDHNQMPPLPGRLPAQAEPVLALLPHGAQISPTPGIRECLRETEISPKGHQVAGAEPCLPGCLGWWGQTEKAGLWETNPLQTHGHGTQQGHCHSRPAEGAPLAAVSDEKDFN